MTGVVKSNRCGTCRDRKVKCDEVKPVCGPCQKRDRVCKSPISKIKFARPRGVPADVAHERDVSHESLASIEPLLQIRILRAVSTTEGSTFQTMRIGRRRKGRENEVKLGSEDYMPLSRRPSLSESEGRRLSSKSAGAV